MPKEKTLAVKEKSLAVRARTLATMEMLFDEIPIASMHIGTVNTLFRLAPHEIARLAGDHGAAPEDRSPSYSKHLDLIEYLQDLEIVSIFIGALQDVVDTEKPADALEPQLALSAMLGTCAGMMTCLYLHHTNKKKHEGKKEKVFLVDATDDMRLAAVFYSHKLEKIIFPAIEKDVIAAGGHVVTGNIMGIARAKIIALSYLLSEEIAITKEMFYKEARLFLGEVEELVRSDAVPVYATIYSTTAGGSGKKAHSNSVRFDEKSNMKYFYKADPAKMLYGADIPPSCAAVCFGGGSSSSEAPAAGGAGSDETEAIIGARAEKEGWYYASGTKVKHFEYTSGLPYSCGDSDSEYESDDDTSMVGSSVEVSDDNSTMAAISVVDNETEDEEDSGMSCRSVPTLPKPESAAPEPEDGYCLVGESIDAGSHATTHS